MDNLSHTLPDLFSELPQYVNSLPLDPIHVREISADSRKVRPGDLFIAFEGEYSDGHEYIQKAIAAGAVAIVGEKELVSPIAVPYIMVENARKVLAHLAAAYYDHPARKLVLIGVTGTDGKTTTSNMIYWILKHTGVKVGLISTVNAVIGDEVIDTGFHVTTPDAMDIQAILNKMVTRGMTHVVLETTSHGWAQYRVDACEFDIGVVTNITHEHLDYHKTYENYLSAKARLLLALTHSESKPSPVSKVAVLNKDDRSWEHLQKFVLSAQKGYGGDPSCDLTFVDPNYTAKGIEFKVIEVGIPRTVFIPIFGDYNIHNALAAIGCARFGLAIEWEQITSALATFPGISGRMETIDLGQKFIAFVDFAHTPNALRSALDTGRTIMNGVRSDHIGRLIVVFGSAGLRDRAKRRMMAEVSAELADVSILTAEDPRTESLDGILDEMMLAAESKGAIRESTVFAEPDRPAALRMAVSMAREGDLVIACGKGHEQSMCFDTTEYPWDDRVALRSAIAELLGIKTEDRMPRLPTSKWEQ